MGRPENLGDEALAAVQADLNAAAERIWEAASPAFPSLSLDVLAEVDSTNTALLARGRSGDTTPALLTAVRQTAGRGRHGRHWQATPGDTLTFSLGLPLQLDRVPGGASAMSLAVGLAVARGLDAGLAQACTPHPVAPLGLKWPNDLWLQGRKLGGILIEASPAPGLEEGQRWVVIGVGINVRPGDAPADATALSGHVPAKVATDLTAGMVWSWIAPPLLAAARAFETEGFAPLRAAYAERDVLAGQRVALWSLPDSALPGERTPSAEGHALGVGETGALLVHTDAGLQSWTTGEVSVRLRA